MYFPTTESEAVETAKDIVPYFNKITVSGVPDMGILIRFFNESNDTAVFFAGYNDNNGYYTDNLTLIVTLSNGFEEEYDIRRFQQGDGTY